MRLHDEGRRKVEWQTLHDRITATLDQVGSKDAFGRGDYWLVDEDWGGYRHKLEVQNLNLLEPKIVKSLQALLGSFPTWEITFRVDVPGMESAWPAMGLIIREGDIIDDLRREYLPEEFRKFTYSGSRRSA